MVRLKHANDEKSITGDREFHTFITLSAKKFLSAVFVFLRIREHSYCSALEHEPQTLQCY